MTFDLKGKRVFVAGHKGMVGQALVRALEKENCEILTVPRDVLDLRDQAQVREWFGGNNPDVVFLAAAKVGGILANSLYPADFLVDNLQIQQNVISSAFAHKVQKLLFLGSSCIYPRLCPQPIEESSLLTGSLEETNQWYAIAKIAGLKMVEAYRRQYGSDFISCMPTNLYGPGDTYHLENSHVIPALIIKFHQAKINKSSFVELWGTGTQRREFLHVDDLARACIHLIREYSDLAPVNVGVGEDMTILELAQKIAKVVGFDGEIRFDSTKPDGTPRKILDIKSLSKTGWVAKIDFEDGLNQAYLDFKQRNIG
jgi:GDP-L-fucose synthase